MRQLLVEARPGASQTKIEQITPQVYKVWLTARPVAGQANQQLVELLADYFGVAKSCVEIKRGKSAKNKVVIIYG
ncbi:MAG TPA: DUF167 domain-containing protein [bacterium]|nr:DUF167 domain-containing protein [bacterium]HNS33919.1 DUF167 domain-containing protein [bacterium]HNW09075.1 DUF167 domain-containing protein [bacterium]HNZ73407.1 DUF167 domain-containing protein [bacterium]HOH67296.1 DUF167 domain-containing protein [bacterium]